MPMLSGERIKRRLSALGLSQAALARAVGVSPQAISKMVTGETAESPKLYQMAKILQTTPEYLTGQTDVDSFDVVDDGALVQKKSAPKSDIVELEEFDVSYGLGATYLHDTPATGRKRVFSRGWIRHFTDSPFEYLFWGRGIGDSMTPTILDSDIVLIDTYQRTPHMIDKIWAIEFGGMGAIKRLRPTADGMGMRILSSNPDVPEQIACDGEMTIIGRVVAVARKI